jgi:hypothetical protein
VILHEVREVTVSILQSSSVTLSLSLSLRFVFASQRFELRNLDHTKCYKEAHALGLARYPNVNSISIYLSIYVSI